MAKKEVIFFIGIALLISLVSAQYSNCEIYGTCLDIEDIEIIQAPNQTGNTTSEIWAIAGNGTLAFNDASMWILKLSICLFFSLLL